MDSSGFNLPLAKKLKKHYPNLEIIYYILPQAWAWKRGRIKVLEQTIDKLASILPFEPSYYSPTAPITYVGHPLLDEITLQKENLDDHNGTIAFMPGSRKGEIQRLLPLFDELRKKMNKKAVLIIPKQFSDDQIEDIYGEYRQHFELSKTTHETLKKAEFAFICSGTATLEATLIGVPFILAYIANPIDFFIAKKLAHIEHVGLANIMMLQAKEGLVHPEYLQDDVTLENLLNAYHSYDYQNYEKQAKKLKSYLNHGSAKNVAKLILE
jgi:lipid-A-disaccharide synthase